MLKLEERNSHLDGQLADLTRQRDELRAELEQIQARSAQTETDTGNARARIEALEGAAAALRTEAEGKARGQSRLQERVSAMTEEIAKVNMRLAALDAERLASEQSLNELEQLRQDLSGDRAERERMMAGFQSRNAALEQEILE